MGLGEQCPEAELLGKLSQSTDAGVLCCSSMLGTGDAEEGGETASVTCWEYRGSGPKFFYLWN